MKLQFKIMIFMTIILIATLGIVSLFSFYQMERNIRNQMSRSVLNTAATISNIKEIQDNLGKKNGADKIQEIVEKIRLKTNVQFITVMDMSSIRYSHPLPEKIGKKFSGGDEIDCLENGQTYTTEGVGTLGKSIRGFMPIYRDGVQVGAVCVGILVGDVNREFLTILNGFVPYLVIGLIFGIIGSMFLANNIKNTIFGLEPKEVASNLRAQNHEFMNKLHTISGLIQLEEYDKALEFIHHTTTVRSDILDTLSNNIKIPSVAGLILSKYNKASENKIKFIVDANSYVEQIPKNLKEDEFVCIIGNLIENSIDAVMGRKDAKIQVLINGSLEKIDIEIANNGLPISEEIRPKIFQRGISTKSGVRGYGLYNIKQIVDKLGGSILFTTGEETVWKVII